MFVCLLLGQLFYAYYDGYCLVFCFSYYDSAYYDGYCLAFYYYYAYYYAAYYNGYCLVFLFFLLLFCLIKMVIV